ncbi:MAG: lasso peptide biosynthesis B2 protein [Acidobacteria bacterium]|nr:MAG: lasso peptide biosynthesis B2 protein [Acidobacteriota bacterium]
MVRSQPRYLLTTKEDGNTSASHRQTSALREPVMGAIVRPWLTAADWRLLVAVAVAQVVAAAALRAMPLQALRARAGRFRRLAEFLVHGSDERIVWAIEATGRRLGRLSTCLIRALVAELVLDANDGPLSLTIGVRRTAAGTLEAHAWLARRDRILIGATADEYFPLVNW